MSQAPQFYPCCHRKQGMAVGSYGVQLFWGGRKGFESLPAAHSRMWVSSGQEQGPMLPPLPSAVPKQLFCSHRGWGAAACSQRARAGY